MGLIAVAILGEVITTDTNSWRFGGETGMINVGVYDGGQWKRVYDTDCTPQPSDPEYPTATIYECTSFEDGDELYISKEGKQFHKVTHHNPTPFDDMYQN